MKRALVLLTVLLVAGCGASKAEEPEPSKGPVASKSIDRDAWRQELVAAGGVRADPNLDVLEKIAREDCKSDVSDLALKLSLAGARPDLTRIDMKYVCPDQVGKVDRALKQLQ